MNATFRLLARLFAPSRRSLVLPASLRPGVAVIPGHALIRVLREQKVAARAS